MVASTACNEPYDILIAGAGAVGAALACGLADSAVRVGVIEAVPLAEEGKSTHDGRGLALSLGSRHVLDNNGVWPLLAEPVCPIDHIHVSHRGHFGVVRFDAAELALPALGYVVPAMRLGRALLDRIAAADNIELICPASLVALCQDGERVSVTLETDDGSRRMLHTSLLIGADGSRSRVRELCNIAIRVKDYGQTAIVGSIRPAVAHANTAYERFTDSGPVALLPLQDGRCVAVCCVEHAEAATLMAGPDTALLDTLQQRFGLRLGRLSEPGPRRSYPLQLVESKRQHVGRVLLLGNSVHTIHPNAAQGFNLGLHDAAALARLIRGADDPGAPEVIRRYLDQRVSVQQRVIRFTDSLAWLFYRPHPLIGPLRCLGMVGLDVLPSLKRAFARRTAGLART